MIVPLSKPYISLIGDEKKASEMILSWNAKPLANTKLGLGLIDACMNVICILLPINMESLQLTTGTHKKRTLDFLF